MIIINYLIITISIYSLALISSNININHLEIKNKIKIKSI